MFGGEVLGVLGVVESRRDRHFTEEEKELLRLLAGPAATALGNARLYRAQQEQARQLAALLDASRALAASVDLDEVLAGVARVAADVSGAAYSTVYEYRPRHDALVYRASHSRQRTPQYVADDPLGTAYPLADWPGERTILEGSATVQEHVSDEGVAPDRRATMEAWGQKTCLSLPLRAAGRGAGHPAPRRAGRGAALHRRGTRIARGPGRGGQRRHPQRPAVPRPGRGERAAARALRGHPPALFGVRPPRRGRGARGRRRPAAGRRPARPRLAARRGRHAGPPEGTGRSLASWRCRRSPASASPRPQGRSARVWPCLSW